MKELDVVKLIKDDLAAGVKSTDLGAIVAVHSSRCFTVEFIDEEGNTIEASLHKEYSEDELILA